jgi:hypothetical protein
MGASLFSALGGSAKLKIVACLLRPVQTSDGYQDSYVAIFWAAGRPVHVEGREAPRPPMAGSMVTYSPFWLQEGRRRHPQRFRVPALAITAIVSENFFLLHVSTVVDSGGAS